MRKITKEFPGVKALNEVSLCVKKGEIHALVGENGAGKSTLMSVLSGIYPYGTYTGDIVFEGKTCAFKDIKESERHGIAIIHQELALSPYMSIAENIFLGNERAQNGVISWSRTHQEAIKLMELVGLKESHDALIRDIGVGKQQLVEIAKALSKDVKLLILDEPTAALNDEDSEHLLNLLTKINSERGISCIIISHKLNEITKISHHITIIRDGSAIETLSKSDEALTEARIIKGMVGRDLVDRFPKRVPRIGEVYFEVKNWTVYDPNDETKMRIDSANIHVKKGEILGIAGLMGAGRTELAMSIFGKAYGRKISGELIKEGKSLHLNTVSEAIDNGLAYVTEDRKSAGLVLIEDIKRNITLANLQRISTFSVVNEDKERLVAEDFRGQMNIKSSSIDQTTGNLSGGNQQKVVLSKWIFSNPDILILDEPTRGIDVGAKYEIYTIIQKLANEGKSVIVISSELPEILGICDRVYVMNEGRIVGEMPIQEASQESIMSCILRSIR
jgi:putative multiple sugar transport system ATP-binding protein